MPPASRPVPASRIPELDVLRGVAVVLVLGRHMGAVPLGAPFVVQSVLDLWLRVGWIGVDLFFVLSGFLVSGLLFREYGQAGDVHVGRFLARRALRIYPAFYVFLLSTSIATGTVGTRQFFAEALFVQNYLGGLWDHTWSLAVEEHFYLLLALLIFVLAMRARMQRGPASTGQGHARDPFTPLVPVFVLVAIAELALRIATARYGKPAFAHHLYPTHLRLDSLLFGVLLAYLAWSRGDAFTAWVRARRAPLVLVGVLGIAPPLFLRPIHWFMETVGFTLLYVGFGSILVVAVYGARPPMWLAGDGSAGRRWIGQARAASARVRIHLGAALAWVGVYSYSIYLWHLAVKRWAVPPVLQALGWRSDGLAALFVYAAASLLVGALMARMIEIPTLAMRERWLPATARAVAHGTRKDRKAHRAA